jgi:PBP1b-binding outer membrane lipoprotein LpoB
MKYVIFAILGSMFLGGCTGGKTDSGTDTSADTAAK